MPNQYHFEPQDILSSEHFSLRENQEMNAAQANETFVVDAHLNRSLGQNGETLGFAKKQFSNAKALQIQRDTLMGSTYEKFNDLSKVPVVMKWLADRQALEDIGPTVERATAALHAAVEAFKETQNTAIPDEEEVKAAREKVTSIARNLAALKRVQDNPAEERKRLIKAVRDTPPLAAFIEAKTRKEAAASLAGSIGAVAESSSHLYEKRGAMADGAYSDDRKLLARAVASHEVDKLLGLNVCAQEKFGIDAQGEVFGVSIQCDGAGVKSRFGKNEYGEPQDAFLDIDYTDPVVQKGLHDLEALDYITSQCDRHTGNIFVDPKSGKVTGIDNDLAFPEVDRATVLNRAPLLKQKTVAGMPKMMHADTAEKIRTVDAGELRRILEAVRPPNGDRGLGEKEIAGALARLKELQDALAQGDAGKIEIVNEFNQDTYDRAIEAQTQKGVECTSLLGSVHNERVKFKTKMDEGDMGHALRGAESVGKAKINLGYAGLKLLTEMEKEKSELAEKEPDYRAAMDKVEDQLRDYRAAQTAVDKVEDQLKAVRQELASMEHPDFKHRVAALKHGGVDGTRRHLRSQEAELQQELANRIKGVQITAADILAKVYGPEFMAGQRAAEQGEGVQPAAVEAMQEPVQPATLPPASFKMQANPDAFAGLQANETFKLTAYEDGALGTDGETVAYAKYQFDESQIGPAEAAASAAQKQFFGLKAPARQLSDAIENLAKARAEAGALSTEKAPSEEQEAQLAGLLQERIPALEQDLEMKCQTATALLRAELPEEQHATLDASSNNPEQLLELVVQTRAAAEERMQKAQETAKNQTKVRTTADNLFPEAAVVPEDRALLTRAVASTMVDRLLQTGIIAEERFGVGEGGRPVGVSVQADGAGIIGKFMDKDGTEKTALLEVTLTDPDIQRGLADLEAVDYITGQYDRHCGNIFVDTKTKKVTGIDNDLAFPEMSREDMFAQEADTMQKTVATMPAQMHKDTASKILDLKVSDLRKALAGMQTPAGVGRLGPASIESACGRLSQLQQELKNPTGAIKVVDKFNEATYLEASARQKEAFLDHAKVSLEAAPNDDHMDKCPKTSYLGAVEVQQKRQQLGIEQQPLKFCMRPANSTERAQRSPAVFEGRVAQLQQNLAELNSRKERYEQRLRSLAAPKARDRVTALAHGGVKGAQKFFQTKQINNEKQIQRTLAKLDKVLLSEPLAAAVAVKTPDSLAKKPKTRIPAKAIDAGGPPVEVPAKQKAAEAGIDPHPHQSVQNALAEAAQHAHHPHVQHGAEHHQPTVQDILQKAAGAGHAEEGQGQKAGSGSLRATWKPATRSGGPKVGSGQPGVHN